jgi:hypothetical protein
LGHNILLNCQSAFNRDPLSARNIGIGAYRIPTEVRQLVDDARYWVENKTYPPDEIAVRFSHRLVSISLLSDTPRKYPQNTPTPNLAACGRPWTHAGANHPQPSAFYWIFGKMRKAAEASGKAYGSGGGIFL